MDLGPLAVIVLAHALLAVAQGESGFGSGEEGSAGDVCKPPNPRPEPIGVSIDTATIEPRCHLACIERISEQEGITLQMSTVYPEWPMIPDSVLEKNCSINRMIQMCRWGCAFRTHAKCIRQCAVEECERADPRSCQICNQGYCRMGCDVMQELDFIKNQTHNVPPNPVGPLGLTVADGFDDFPSYSDAGLYYMDPTNAVPSQQSSNVQRYPTAVVVRVTYKGKIKYIWMTSFEERLNLTAYACQEVKITVGAVNKFGVANRSYTHISSLPIEVYGETPPTYAHHPDRVTPVVTDDSRPGYWKHAVITIYWKAPTKGPDLLDHYEIDFKVDPTYAQPYCKPNRVTGVVNKTRKNVVDVKWAIQAASLGDGPVSDCHYTVQIKSISMNRTIATPPAPVHYIHVKSSDTTQVPLNLTYNRTWDEKSGNFTYKLDWRMPTDVNIQRAIGLFEVVVETIAPDGSNETLHTTTYTTTNSNVLDYHYSQQVKHDGLNYRHQITLSASPGDLSLVTLLPEPHTPDWPASAIVPPQVDGLETEYSIKDDGSSMILNLVATWTPVETEGAYYRLRIVNKNTTRDYISSIHSDEPVEARAVITELKVSLDNTRPFLYIQVRAVSRHMAEGLWSEAVSIELPALLAASPEPRSTTIPSSPGEPSTDGSTSSDDGSVHVVYIIVSVTVLLVVCVAILAVVIFLTYYQTIKNRKNRRGRVDIVFMTRKASDKDKYPAGKLDQWEIYSNQMAIQSRLGEGAFGDVYRGMFNSSITQKSNNVKKFDANNSVIVAVKLLRDDAMDKDRQIFLKHILQAKKVAQYQHPNLVALIGCVTEQEPLSLLTEYPVQGDLLTYLRTQRQEMYQSQLQLLDYQDGELSTIMPQYTTEQSLQAQDLMLFISHVAAGLEHLASIGVVHGDVACRNLFLTADKVVKIADFGLDSISEDEKGLVYVTNELGRLPIRWMAIESIRDGEFSTSSDVWAFGVTLWEIASLGGFPYHDTANSDILATLSAGQRLQCPTNCSEEIHGIMLKCCAAFPNDRPSFSTLRQVFKSLHTTANNGQYITLNVDMNTPYYLVSPRSSLVESSTYTDDCMPLMDPLGSDSIKIEIITPQAVSSHTTGGDYSAQPQTNQHSHTESYSYSENGFLPCITEEGEDVTDNDDEMEDTEGDKRDSGTFSHESGGKMTKESDKDDSEENLIVAGTM